MSRYPIYRPPSARARVGSSARARCRNFSDGSSLWRGSGSASPAIAGGTFARVMVGEGVRRERPRSRRIARTSIIAGGVIPRGLVSLQQRHPTPRCTGRGPACCHLASAILRGVRVRGGELGSVGRRNATELLQGPLVGGLGLPRPLSLPARADLSRALPPRIRSEAIYPVWHVTAVVGRRQFASSAITKPARTAYSGCSVCRVRRRAFMAWALWTHEPLLPQSEHSGSSRCSCRTK